MSDNQYLEIIENKIDDLNRMVEQQSKSGVFFDGFTKQILEKINDKLEYISNFENNELIGYVTEEMKKNLNERYNSLQIRLDSFQGLINNLQTNLNDSLKTPEVVQVFTKLSDSILDFSRDLNVQTRYFSSTVEKIQSDITNIDIKSKLEDQTNNIKAEIDSYKANIENLSVDINSNFESIKKLIDINAPTESILSLSGDLSVVQKGMNDVISAVMVMNTKQGELVTNIANLSANADVQDIRVDVSSMLAEMQVLKDSIRILVNKADIEALNEKLNYAIEMVNKIKEFSVFSNDENKSAFKTYFNDLNQLISSLVSKEESAQIKEQLEIIQSSIVSDKNDVKNSIEINNNEIKNLIPIISSLSTRENLEELSKKAISSIQEITDKWNEKITGSTNLLDEKLEAFKMALSNIYENLSAINSKVSANGGVDEVLLKEQVSSLIGYIDNALEQVSTVAKSSATELNGKFDNIATSIVGKIDYVSSLINGFQEDLRANLSENIFQLRDFSQKLVETVADFSGKLDIKTEEIKFVFNERSDILNNKIDSLASAYLNSSVENKAAILESIENLKTITEASKAALDNDKIFNLIEEKITLLNNILQNNKEEIVNIANRSFESVNSQNALIEVVSNSVKDLYISLSDAKSIALSNKEEIINEITQKVYTMSSLIEEAKSQVNENLFGNKSTLLAEFELIKEATNDIKTVLNDVNKNQASKEILAAILESVTSKLDEVSNLININKDYNLQQYDGIKQITFDLKDEIANILIHLNQSSEFAKNILDRMSAGFLESADNFAKNIFDLKNEIKSVDDLHNADLVARLEQIDAVVKKVQSDVASFNFDESVKEQLLDLKRQIEAFNQESLLSILNRVTENNEQTSKNVKESVEDMKVSYSNLLSHINNIQNQFNDVQENFARSLALNLSEVSNKFEILTNNIESNSYSNKEQILSEIAGLQNISAELQNSISDINKNMLKDEFIIEQTQQLYSLINNFAANVEKKLEIINDTDKSYVTEAVRSAFDEFRVQISDSVNYLKGLNLNLDRSLSGVKNAVLESVEKIKDNVVRNIESINSLKEDLDTKIDNSIIGITELIDKSKEQAQGSKEEIISKINIVSEEIHDKLLSAQEQSQSNKNEIITELSGAVSEKTFNLKQIFEAKLQDALERFNEKISLFTNGLHASSSKNIEQLLNTLSELKTSADGVKTELDELISKTKSEMQEFVGEKLGLNLLALNEKIEQLQNDLAHRSENDKGQLLDSIQTLHIALEQTANASEKIVSDCNEFIKSEVVDKFESSIQNCLKRIDSASESLINGSLSNKSEIIENIQSFKSEIETYKINFVNVENSILQTKDSILAEFDDRLDDIVAGVENLVVGISQKTEKTGEEISNLAKKIVEEVSSFNSNFASLLDGNIEKITKNIESVVSSNQEEIISSLEQLQANSIHLKENINALEESVANNISISEKINEDIKHVLGTSFANIAEILEKNSVNSAEFEESLKFELKKSIDEITTKLFKYDEDTSSLKEDLLYELQKNYKILTEKIDNQKEQTEKIQTDLKDSAAEHFKIIENKMETGYSEIKEGIVNDIAKEIDLSELKSEICNNILSDTSALAARFEDLVADINSNKSLYESLSKSNKNEILTQISLLRDEIFKVKTDSDYSAITSEFKSIAEKIDGVSDDLLDALSNDLEASFSDNIKIIKDTIDDKISFIKDDIQEIVLKISNVDTITDKVKDIVVLQFEDYFGSFDSKINVLGEDIKKYFDKNTEKITAAIEDYQKELNNLCDIDLSEYSDDTKKFVEEQISQLKEKIEELRDSNNIDYALQEITSSVNASSDIINKRLEAIRDIIISEMPNEDDINDNFDELRVAINDIQSQTQNIEGVIRDENSSLRNVIERYQDGIKALSNLDVTSNQEETRGFIKDELKHLKEQFVRSLANVFENISFIEESEEIQNVIYDNTDDIKNEIGKLKQELVKNSNSNEGIDEKFNNLKTILEGITTGTTSDAGKYVYTLPDVETDLAKMRMAINDVTNILKRSQEDGSDVAERLDSINDIREDISSISKRTNKLILTSEESNKHLKENIAEFKKVIEELGYKCLQLDNSQLNSNISDVKSLVLSSLKSDKILNEAFMHLAAWIDDSAKSINTLNAQVEDNKDTLKEIKYDINKLEEKTDEISRVKDAISELTLKFEKKFDTDYSKFLYDIECGLDKLNDKLEVQELKIKSLEKKLDNITNAPIGNDETNSLLEFIASQVSAANENSRSNKLLLQKIEMMEKQMSQFENNISKITAFVDGVN